MALDALSEKEAYLKDVLIEIERIKAHGGHSLYRISSLVSDKTARYIYRVFQGTPGYSAEIRKCSACKKNTWDIIINWNNHG
jgi:hypothetical protein